MDCRVRSMKRCRTRFNSRQVQRLEQVFHKTHYPDSQQMNGLSAETNIPTPKMQIWFQNRRAKWRKNSRLRNFGGLGSVKETAYVPAPHICDTLKSLAFNSDSDIYSQRDCEAKSEESKAIDLRIRSLNDCELSSHLLTIVEKSNVYKKSGGITSTAISNDMNAFEYPTAYYSRHYMDNKEMPFPFASNQTMTSLLFAPHLYSLSIQSDPKYDSNVQNTDINK